jgi:hypothetical protein
VAAVAAGGAVASRVEARDTAPTVTIRGPIAEPVSIAPSHWVAPAHSGPFHGDLGFPICTTQGDTGLTTYADDCARWVDEMSAAPWVTYRGRVADRALRRVEFGPFTSGEHTHAYTVPRLGDLP